MNKKKIGLPLAAALLGAVLVQPASARDTDTLGIACQGAVSPEYLFEGRISGVDVTSVYGGKTGSVSTVIRGVNALKGNSQPVWIVDGAVLGPVGDDVDPPFWQYRDRIWSAGQNTMLGFSVHDIESIEILKDISATAIYGSLGANGVVIVNTKKASSGKGFGVCLNSNLELPGFSHSHHASVSGSKNRNRYFISGHWKGLAGQGSHGGEGGFRFNFDALTNNVFTFGFSSMASTSSFGMEIPMAEGDTDDDTSDYRTTDSFWMDVALPGNVHVRADMGVDYRSRRRYIWYGVGTELGEEQNGAASIASLFSVRMNASLQVEHTRWIGKNHLVLRARGEVLADDVNGSVMNGFDFFDYGLRGKGINISASPAVLHRSDYESTRLGGYLRAEYDRDGIFGGDLTLRADAFPYFNSGRIALRPSVNAFVDLGRLAGLSGTLSSARITSGWGKAGLDTFVPYAHIGDYSTTYPVANDFDLQAFYRGLSSLESSEFNVTLHAGLLSERIRLTAAFYDRKTRDTFSVYCNGQEFGSNGFWRYTRMRKDWTGTGCIANRGVEADIDADILRSGDFRLSARLNVAFNHNLVLEVPGLDNAPHSFLHRWAYSDVPGWAADAIIGFEDVDGILVDQSGDGALTDADRITLASTQPKVLFGTGVNASWKRLSFEALLSGRFGGKTIDFDALSKDDLLLGAKAPVLKKHVISNDSFRPARLSVSYDVPLGKLSSKAGLRVNLSAVSPLHVSGLRAFDDSSVIIGGICLTI